MEVVSLAVLVAAGLALVALECVGSERLAPHPGFPLFLISLVRRRPVEAKIAPGAGIVVGLSMMAMTTLLYMLDVS